MIYLYNGIKNEGLIRATTCISFKNIYYGEELVPKNAHCIILFIKKVQNRQTCRDKKYFYGWLGLRHRELWGTGKGDQWLMSTWFFSGWQKCKIHCTHDWLTLSTQQTTVHLYWNIPQISCYISMYVSRSVSPH